MAWEERNGRMYYYRKRREGGRVVSEYVGAGIGAEAIATMDRIDQEEQKIARLQMQDERMQYMKDERTHQAIDEGGSFVGRIPPVQRAMEKAKR
jgi:hypothetical protein